MKGDRDKCLQAGMDVYIAKPLHKDELLKTLEQFSRTGDYAGLSPMIVPSRVMNVDDALRCTGGNSALLKELCEVFLEESPILLEQLSRSIEGGEPAEVHQIAHRLKTTVGTLAAPGRTRPRSRLNKRRTTAEWKVWRAYELNCVGKWKRFAMRSANLCALRQRDHTPEVRDLLRRYS